MRILITNDDGIYAEGMIPFVKWAKKLGDVTVIAPKVEQSGKSHGIDIHHPFEVKKIDLLPDVTAFSLDSTPADCIRYAILGRKEHYDLVLSGINRGFNMGQDIIYSGTMGAAEEAAYQGLTAIAISTDPEYYPNAVEHLDKVWDFFQRNRLLEKHRLYNVNIPPMGKDIHITKQGPAFYSDEFINEEGDLYKAHGICVYKDGSDLSIDTHCVMNGFISVCPIAINRTEEQLFESLQGCK